MTKSAIQLDKRAIELNRQLKKDKNFDFLGFHCMEWEFVMPHKKTSIDFQVNKRSLLENILVNITHQDY